MKPARMLTHKIHISFADLFLFPPIDEAGNFKRGSYH
jgi:hypothetical protein